MWLASSSVKYLLDLSATYRQVRLQHSAKNGIVSSTFAIWAARLIYKRCEYFQPHDRHHVLSRSDVLCVYAFWREEMARLKQ
jgi:hypothetical protein